MPRRPRTAPTNSAIDQAYGKALRAYGHRTTVTAVDVGPKYVGGRATAQRAVRIHVREKLAEPHLEAAEIFPKQIDGVPVDVIQAVYRPRGGAAPEGALARRAPLDPLRPGISVGHPATTAGTLGAIVYDARTGQACMLSNSHVLSPGSGARPGDPILQPGPDDGGREDLHTVATLERRILGAQGDAAIAVLNDSRRVDAREFESDVTLTGARPVALGEVLEKSGRTTDVTRARVDGRGRYFIDYDGRREGIDGFKLVASRDGNPDDEEISSDGDSGSIWYDPQTGEGVGLHFAGETDRDPSQEHALACHLTTVLEALGVSLTPPAEASERLRERVGVPAAPAPAPSIVVSDRRVERRVEIVVYL